jgi:hypothetical protein
MLSFDFGEAGELLNEAGRDEWELVSVAIEGTEAMFTMKRFKAKQSSEDPLWK